jgi:PTS system N-acetylgalactosamine-specific IIA component
MTNVIVIGHGAYGTMIRESLKMLVGTPEGFYYLDFDIHDDLEVLKSKLKEAVAQTENNPILFACDLTGGSPFREASLIVSENPGYSAVAGLNTAGFAEMVYNLELSPVKLAELAIQALRESMMIFTSEGVKTYDS